jgi:hypothetical protein
MLDGLSEALSASSDFTEKIGAVLLILPIYKTWRRQRLADRLERDARESRNPVEQKLSRTLAVHIRARLALLDDLDLIACVLGGTLLCAALGALCAKAVLAGL